jgi:amidase
MAPAGACYLPATVIPVGLKNGLPVGIQIVGAYLEDRTTLDLADQMLTLLGSPSRPPGF